MTVKIAPSILACDFLHLEEEIRRAEEAGADLIHCDVMDGIYVPNISFGFDIIGKIRKITSLPLDVHMMTVQPEKYLTVLRDIGADSVTVHHDNRDGHPEITLREIRSLGMKCGLSISPEIPAETVFPYLKESDMILIMSVHPGFGGQKFMPECSEKIRVIKAEMKRKRIRIPVEIDGGINGETAAKAVSDGADILVVGSASFGSPDMKKIIKDMKGLSR
ncbi:MAG: ribulose-phosphate 3-epimerase [Clostridia bacterium]|nr:ribulose-phosphate 3-epimerase [Clostridia bacterium]